VTQTPRTGRRAGESGSREAILAAARRLFAERGYDGASLRAIGAAAGVDAALVVHFFGTKAKLLTAAVQWPFDPDEALERIYAADNPGEAVTRLFVTTWDELGDRNPIITLLRSATTEPAAAALMHEFLTRRLLLPLLDHLGSDQRELRADLVAGQLFGLGITRYIVKFEPLASEHPETVVRSVGPSVQRYLTSS